VTKELAVGSRQRTASRFLLQQGCFTKSNMTVSPTHHACLFRRLNIKLKCNHFDTTEVIEAELMAVPKTLT
jgi:hypothetical protein